MLILKCIRHFNRHKMATQPTANTLVIQSAGGSHGFGSPNTEYRKDTSQTTTTSTPSVFYELYTNNSLDVQFGLEFKFESNVTKVYCLSSNNSGNPHLLQIGSGTKATVVTIANNDLLTGYHSLNGSTPIPLFYLQITNAHLWTAPAPTVTPATYGAPTAPSGRTSLSFLFRIYDLNVEKNGDRGYRVRFQHEDAGSNIYNVHVCYTNTSNVYTTDIYSVNPPNVNNNTVYLDKVLTSLPKAGTIEVKFQRQATLAGNPNQTFAANAVMKSYTYVPNDLSITFSPNVGTPGTSVTIDVTGSDDAYISTATAVLVAPDSSLQYFNKNSLGQFANTTTFNVIEGTYTLHHPHNVHMRASATYDATYVAPSTASNGGGKRRYPIISTNLFDRQRSIFSIGLTHKDETLF